MKSLITLILLALVVSNPDISFFHLTQLEAERSKTVKRLKSDLEFSKHAENKAVCSKTDCVFMENSLNSYSNKEFDGLRVVETRNKFIDFHVLKLSAKKEEKGIFEEFCVVSAGKDTIEFTSLGGAFLDSLTLEVSIALVSFKLLEEGKLVVLTEENKLLVYQLDIAVSAEDNVMRVQVDTLTKKSVSLDSIDRPIEMNVYSIHTSNYITLVYSNGEVRLPFKQDIHTKTRRSKENTVKLPDRLFFLQSRLHWDKLKERSDFP